MSFRGFIGRLTNNTSSASNHLTTAAASARRLNPFSRVAGPTMDHRHAIAPSNSHLAPALAALRCPNRWLSEVSHLIQMMEMAVERLSNPTPTSPPTPGSSDSHRRLSVASVRSALDRLTLHRRPSQPERTIYTEIYADAEAIMAYRVSQIEMSRCAYFLVKLSNTRGRLAALGASEVVEAVDPVIEKMREWLRVEEVAGQGAGAVIFGSN